MSEPAPPDPTTRFFGGLLVAVGALIFAFCGLCTLSIAGFSLFAAFTEPGGLSAGIGLIVTALALGGLPALGGFFLMRFGLRKYRGPRPLPRDVGKVFDE